MTANLRFFRHLAEGQVGTLVAANAVARSLATGEDFTIAWGTADLWATSVDKLEEQVFRPLQPATLVCPERQGKLDRWIMHTAGAAASLPAGVLQHAVFDHVSTAYPTWERGREWTCAAFLLRHNVNAEELGLVEALKPTPDDILASVADDPAVRAADRAADPSLPETMAALVHARLAAQIRAGVPPECRVPVYTGETESILVPLIMRMGRGDGPAFLSVLRKEFCRRYLNMGDAVLEFALRSYPHGGEGIEALRAAAREATAAPAA